MKKEDVSRPEENTNYYDLKTDAVNSLVDALNEEPKEEPLPNGIQRIESDNNKSYGIYTILGVKISDNPNDIDNLPKGLYIINGRKYIK